MGARVSTRLTEVVLVLGMAMTLGCAGFRQPEASVSEADHAEVYRRADTARSQRLLDEIERLRADLRDAESALVAAESGLRGRLTRADAVSLLAEARIQVERAAVRVPWREVAAKEARSKLVESDKQLKAGHFGSAIFFASRAQRIARDLLSESEVVRKSGSVLYVTGQRVNLRSGPSTGEQVVGVLIKDTPVFPERHEANWLLVRTPAGRVGWVHQALVGAL